MIKSLDKLVDEIKTMAIKSGATLILPIRPDEVVVSNWVRLKCQFGCPSYAKKLSCPPYSPTPEDTKKVLDEYKKAYLIGYEGSTVFKNHNKDEIDKIFPKMLKDVRKSLFEIERHVFLSGYYKAFVYGFCGPCKTCDVCVIEDGILSCRYAAEHRPSMEAAGIDVFKTVKNAGLELKVQSSRDVDELRMYTLLLVE